MEQRKVHSNSIKAGVTPAFYAYCIKILKTYGGKLTTAPAAADTIIQHLKDTGTQPSDYDMILTGDLGALGSRVVKDLTWEKGFDISKVHVDCGEIIYKVVETEFQGGSGAGCSAVVLNSYVLTKMRAGLYKRILFAATGALLSTVSSGQGESIPCISHAVELEF